MRERPIIFNADMVRAVLDGRKTQTRRIVNGVPSSHDFHGWVLSSTSAKDEGKACWAIGKSPLLNKPIRVRCPFGEVGDRLWVRESFYEHGRWQGGGYDPEDSYFVSDKKVLYPADGIQRPAERKREDFWRSRPSIHMPRWASRITLEITGVRVERIQDINHDDSYAEGIHTEVWDQTVVAKNYRETDAFFQFWSEDMDHYVEMDELYCQSFGSLWQSIYGDDSWQANPWVWVIEFKRVEVE
ncbi:hypothetical protein [Pantoea vagans]|uniref:hypothetical protein n=1 Tax=Pantoea vagans TaxID=470934 RepID=UPI0023B024A2|nr:hypothetical protein [Pantoea vagans]MDE8557004.1 hypothetical protein [Pantoea vagans]MDE8577010.1 hypothetical protein [Pantoea vagans]